MSTIFSSLQPKPKRRCIVVQENSDETLKNNVCNYLTRLVNNVEKTSENCKKGETDYCMSG